MLRLIENNDLRIDAEFSVRFCKPIMTKPKPPPPKPAQPEPSPATNPEQEPVVEDPVGGKGAGKTPDDMDVDEPEKQNPDEMEN